jgi:hypothetical protein
MRAFVDCDLIAEKLEIARTLGLLTRYVLRPTDGTDLTLRVWLGPAGSEQAVRHYLTRLLDGLISNDHLVVVSDSEVPARSEPVEETLSTSVPAAA